MGSEPLLIRLGGAAEVSEGLIGGKARALARLGRAGYAVPRGFCLTTRAYEEFVAVSGIRANIAMEMGRKRIDDLRWEEIWDAALRIRAMFVGHPLSDALREAIADAVGHLDPSASLAVRSSAVGEDSAGRSFAGLHESVLGVRGARGVEEALPIVWASLWSDAALLYREELDLDPARSQMAVVVQEMVEADRSGVAFSRDPRSPGAERAIVESVAGPCRLLVDGEVDPDRWELDRGSGRVLNWRAGQRADGGEVTPLLEAPDLERILETLLSIEELFGWAPDMEWTGREDSFTVLQARPITTAPAPAADDKRSWYLTLRPGEVRLRELRKRVADELIPELEAEGQALADEPLEELDDRGLAGAIERRSEAVRKWRKIYWDEFIPFAHGVRRLATCYNDAVRPEDPYEFVALLQDQPLLAVERNRAIEGLARRLADEDALRAAVEALIEKHAGALSERTVGLELRGAAPGADRFLQELESLGERFLDVVYDHERLRDRPEPLLRTLVELSRRLQEGVGGTPETAAPAAVLEKRWLDAVDSQRHDEVREIIETGRVSWKLRDDDNLLVARLESQLLRALDEGARRLRQRGGLDGGGRPTGSHAEALAGALRDPSGGPVRIEASAPEPRAETAVHPPGETPRQMVGQPASPGVATGTVRCVRGRDDLGSFRRGEVLVCDAIQPTMTHLVPLASAIVERRGGMLIHGAIIARELGIPCVNGVRSAAETLSTGDFVTVDGFLGIVTVGMARLDLELDLELG